MSELLYKELTGTIIGIYYDIYNGLSHNYPEYIYENAFVNELKNSSFFVDKNLQVQQQEEYRIFYKDKLVGVQKLDIFVTEQIIVELKVVEKLLDIHKIQTLSYLKTFNKKVGLLFNFGSEKPEFERIFFDRPILVKESREQDILSSDNLLYPNLCYSIIGAMQEVHSILGPGFVHRIYANACYHEFNLRDISVMPYKEMKVIFKEKEIGALKFDHFIVDNSVMVFPVAIKSIDQIKIDNIQCWMKYNNVKLSIMGNFYADNLIPKFIRI